ncbi:hypothetical protein HNY73_013067 [Argiope bruennichi]|uniref:Uncharacterized protein n=1 Tax=Argiope bruennichi TaxID=94029 RepID=A0A8T0EYI9_ARGBR|nr:hypothetical protein HNY73_013067 [Argiope bruennichi]
MSLCLVPCQSWWSGMGAVLGIVVPVSGCVFKFVQLGYSCGAASEGSSGLWLARFVGQVVFGPSRCGGVFCLGSPCAGRLSECLSWGGGVVTCFFGVLLGLWWACGLTCLGVCGTQGWSCGAVV